MTLTPEFVLVILREEAERWGTTVEEILAGSRHTNVVQARKATVKRIRERPVTPSTPTIGRWLGMHHTSVLHHLGRIDKRHQQI